jgi:hypothetical protein
MISIWKNCPSTWGTDASPLVAAIHIACAYFVIYRVYKTAEVLAIESYCNFRIAVMGPLVHKALLDFEKVATTIFTRVLPPLFLPNFTLKNMGGGFTRNINVISP